MGYRTYKGNTRSYSGWRFITYDSTVTTEVPGTEVRIPIRRGEVATILNAWAALWNRHVREIRQVDSGGWTNENDHPTSNHLSGTAVDLNWQTLPFREKTMPAGERKEVHRLLRAFKGVLSWGGDWSSPIDEMHTELAVPEGDKRVTDLAKELSDGYLGVYVPEKDPEPPMPEGIRSLVDGKLYSKDEMLAFLDLHTWRSDALLCELAKKQGIPTSIKELRDLGY